MSEPTADSTGTLFTSAFVACSDLEEEGHSAQATLALDRIRQTILKAGGTGCERMDLTVWLTDPKAYAAHVRPVLVNGLGQALGSLSEVAVRRIAQPGAVVTIEASASLLADPNSPPLQRIDQVTGSLPRSTAVATHANRLVLVAGQVANNADGQMACLGDFAGQTARAYDNVLDVIAAAGGTPASIVRETIWTLDLERWMAEGPASRDTFYGGAFPAASVVEISALSAPDQLVEIEIIAAVL
jgi:2-iminobutanoate/2-iminopropanoate deaminase